MTLRLKAKWDNPSTHPYKKFRSVLSGKISKIEKEQSSVDFFV